MSCYRRLACAALAVVAMHGVGWAQVGVPDSLNSTSSPNGFVHAVVAQSTGDVVIGGEFTSMGGIARGRIARLKSDGTLDPVFATGAGANGPIRALAVAVDGDLYIGGDFTTYDGVSRNRIARLNSNGSLDTAFNPGTGANSTVHAIGADAFGGVFIGGDFTAINGTTRNRIAYLSSNGALDPFVTFGTGANGTVYAITGADSLQNSNLLIGGAFTTFNGVSRNRLVKCSRFSGMTDPSFNVGATAGPDGTVYAIWGESGSDLYIGGSFNSVGGTAHPNLAAVSTTSAALVTSFTATASGAVRSLFGQGASPGLSPVTQILAVGDFTAINGTARNRIARLIRTSPLPGTTSWSVDTSYSSIGADASVTCIASVSDGKMILGGQFSTIGDLSRPYLARLYGNGGVNPPAQPATPTAEAGTDSNILLLFSGVSYATGYKIERSPDGLSGWEVINVTSSTAYFADSGLSPGTIYFYRVRAYSTNGDGAPSASASVTTRIAPWMLAGSVDTPFAANLGDGANNSIYATAIQPDGKILLGGYFSSITGQTRQQIARLNSDGTLDPSFDVGPSSNFHVRTITVQADGKILAGGDFTSFGGTARNRIVRLNSDGSIDTSFAPTTGANRMVYAIGVQSDGRIVVCGSFTSFNSVSRNGIARLNPDGSLDTTFDPGSGLSFPNGYTLALQPDGKCIVGGFFPSVNGVTRGNIARFNSDGSLDTSFATGSGAGGWIESLKLQSDGRIVIVGAFSTYDGVSRNGIARLLSDGSLDPSFAPGTGVERGWPFAVAVQPDGKIILSGWFTVARGKVRPRLARFNHDGALDDTFLPGLGANSNVYTLALQPDGKIILGGHFTAMGDSTVKYVSRLLADNGSAAPDVPTTLTATVNSPTQLTLDWSDVALESSYTIEQSADGMGNWTEIAATGADETSYVVLNLAPGTGYFFRVHARSTNGSSASTTVAEPVTRTAYQQWKLDHSLPIDAAATADPDDDGLSTLLEYALASSPISAASANLPLVVTNGASLELHYGKIRADVIYTVESSNDLQTWTTTGVDQGGAGPQVVASIPIEGARKFLRLKITLP